MRYIILMWVLCSSSSAIGQGTLDSLISIDFDHTPLVSALHRIENDHHITFFYQEEWVSDITVTKSFHHTPLKKVIRGILSDGGLSMIAFNPYTVYIINEVPEVIEQEEKSMPEIQEPSLDQPEMESVTIGKPNGVSRSANATLNGYIRDENTGETLIGGTVYFKELKNGTSSNANGYYSITVPVGTYIVEFNSLGFKKETKKVTLNQSGTFDISLSDEALQMEDIIITGEAADANVSSTRMSVTKLSMKTIEKIPAFLGEVDVIKSLILLPSVSTVGEGASGFNVRGGDIDQNLVLLDGAPVFNSSHVFGFFSVFNPDAVEEVTLYSGGISARYGGRLSSILDVRQAEGNSERFSFKGGLGIVSSRLTVEGPIIKDKSSILLAGRTSYSDWILERARDLNVKNSSAGFHDVTAKVDHTFDERNKLSLSSYLGDDRFRLGLDTTYCWGNRNAVLTYNRIWGENLFSNISAVYSKYYYDVENQEAGNAFELKYNIDYKGLNADFTFSPRNHQIDMGLSSIWYGFQPGRLVPTSNISRVNPFDIENDQSREMAVYINDNYKINQRFSVMYGLRYSLFHNLGPGDVYVYEEGIPRAPGTIVDTLQFSDGEIIKSYGGFEPRFSLKIGLGKSSSLKLSYNRMRQYVSIISNTTAVTPIDIWQTSNTHIKPQIGDQVIVGYFHNFANNTIETSVEAYYKRTTQLVEYKDGANLLLNRALEADLLEGKGKAYGVEFQVKKKGGLLTGWGSYVYSRSLRKVEGEALEETLNFGKYFPSNYDKPHNVKLVANYKISTRWSFSANFTYSTGRPFTAPYSKYNLNSGIITNVTIANFSQRNQYRIPDYHRLDISFTLDELNKRNRKWKGSWTLSVYNLYGRRNPYSVFFQNTVGEPPQPYRLAILGNPFPALTYNFDF